MQNSDLISNETLALLGFLPRYDYEEVLMREPDSLNQEGDVSNLHGTATRRPEFDTTVRYMPVL